MKVIKPIVVFNMSTLEEQHYHTNPDWAVCASYCMEHHKTNELLAWANDGRFEEYKETLPIEIGMWSIACGDWVTMLKPETESYE